MSRRERPGGVDKPRKVNNWVTGKNLPGPVKRRLRNANIVDRLLISLLFFVVFAVGTGGIYFYMSTNNETNSSNYGRNRVKLPLETLTGLEARSHFLLVCLIGGLIGVAIYLYLTFKDPYGTTGTAKAAEKEIAEKKDRFAFLSERESGDHNPGTNATNRKPPA